MIPITFVFEGKTFRCAFTPVAGGANPSKFHLMDRENYYVGTLFFGFGIWPFHSNKYERMTELSDYFGDYVTSWCESL